VRKTRKLHLGKKTQSLYQRGRTQSQLKDKTLI